MAKHGIELLCGGLRVVWTRRETRLERRQLRGVCAIRARGRGIVSRLVGCLTGRGLARRVLGGVRGVLCRSRGRLLLLLRGLVGI